jgi:DNA-binding CsgD family transcriptional regulator
MGSAGIDLWPFVCRDKELTLIEGNAAQGAVLVGEAGVGKSRLLTELVERGEAEGRRVVRVVATRSLTAVPFGAFAGVFAGAPDAGAPFDVLQRALRVLAGGGGLGDVLLAVDDAHLLDDLSAGLVVLAAQSGARVLATARSREPGPEAVTRLWKDEFALRVELRPLDEEQLVEVLQAALGGLLDGRARRKFYEETRGNLLFLRELVRHALLSGTLVERGTMWSWTPSDVDVPAVHDLVLDRLGSATAPVRGLVDLLAVAEPLGAALVGTVCTDVVLADAEREGLIVWHSSGLRRDLRLVHPLYAEVVRESLGGARRAALSLRVADMVAATGARRHDDRLRVAVLRLDGGHAGDPDDLNAATRDAFALADTVLGERLARAGIAAGGSSESEMLLGEVLYWSGRHEEVVELLGSGMVDVAPPEIAAHAALLVASALYWGLGRFEEADAWLDHGATRAGMPFALELIGQRAQMLMFAGRAIESIEVGRTVIDDPRSSPVARLRAYSGMLPSAGVCGRLEEVDAEIPVAMGLVMGTGSDMAFAAGGVMIASFIARLFSGGLDQLDMLVGALHGDALRRVDDPFRGVWSFLLGRSALAQGRLSDATTRLRDSASLLRGRDPGGMLPWALAALAQTLGATDDAAGATQAVAELDAVHMPSMHNIDVDIELGRAWAAAARGERSHAREIAEKIGRSLVDDGRVAIGVLALHDALRLGAGASTLVEALDLAAETCDGAVVEAFAEHAHALIDHDPSRLLRTSDLFEAVGWRLHAAECAAGASRLAADRGLRALQREAATRSASLAVGCGPALTPMLETIAGKRALGTLTRREQEIALLAARGLSKREIAGTLLLSPRTVGNHINHVYSKLGITSREELRAAIGVDASARPTG